MDFQTIASIVIPICGFIGWMISRLDKKFDKIDSRFDKLEDEMKEIRTSLNRMEGAFYSKECCMLKDEKQMRKVE